ncbi:LysE family translocator [Streptomyces sp. B-S-A8]|uniref:LysE family translocator n=1 Tax=Streptomyces solicavernae TaxID=3043614 RepID=A0ABT6RY55_9ACTN|nr:LysE family translocator [Streptomyces sp. B-S-A8]MDI3389358.1 LysE family translocator [Streptomyces sp. B-S-A8]
MSLSLLASFTLSAFLLNLSPGPSILYVMSRSVSGGRVAGISAAFGLASGSAMWAVLTAIGVSEIIASSETAFDLMRYAGAAYLLYLGISGLRGGTFTVPEGERPPPVSRWKSFAQGFVVEGTNPKTVTFFLALVPQLMATLDSPTMAGLVAFCLIVPLTALPIDVTVGVTGGALVSRLARRPKVGQVLNWLSCAVLIGLALLVLFR